ncbi:MAG: hypothetical protein NTV02_03175 [Candidatus Zambryskibacteria bacterium]|nr:hypothetical protein [Candidatus Zambryskibacteria bacterium]
MTRQEELQALVAAGQNYAGVIYNAPAHLCILRHEPGAAIHANRRWGAALIGKFGSAELALDEYIKARVETEDFVVTLGKLLGVTEKEVEDLECEALSNK